LDWRSYAENIRWKSGSPDTLYFPNKKILFLFPSHPPFHPSYHLHSTSFFFQFIHSISFPPIKSLSGLFHSDKFVLIIFVQAEKCCCRFRSSYQVSAANTLCLCNQSNSVSKRKIYSQRYHHQRAARIHSTYKARKQSKVSHHNQQRDQMQTYEGMFQIFNQQFNVIYAWFSNRGRSHLMQWLTRLSHSSSTITPNPPHHPPNGFLIAIDLNLIRAALPLTTRTSVTYTSVLRLYIWSFPQPSVRSHPTLTDLTVAPACINSLPYCSLLSYHRFHSRFHTPLSFSL